MASAEIPSPVPDVTNPADPPPAADGDAAVSAPSDAPAFADVPASADAPAPAVSSSPPLPAAQAPPLAFPLPNALRVPFTLPLPAPQPQPEQEPKPEQEPEPEPEPQPSNKVTACADSLRNNCFRGRTCRYYHPPPHIQESLLKSIGVEDPKVKMQVCRDFARGKCSRSANECRFLHHSSVEDCAIVRFLLYDNLYRKKTKPCPLARASYSHAVAHSMPPMGNVPMQYPEMLYMPPPPLGVPMMGPPPSPPRAFAGE
ncbi:hypothetical protein PR202_ga20269 [Eleusine coracana subsp. coracana]|uniref:C3H1-type domain-containing protein n=1 Tax=Eleusine coracana subsp. coracana TaxID=191504 RepID=A0AAV5CY10_ELECO|nr:hypothetical protein PR202_ga20269 [Eleusine coracana subsp. coracana]